jgi:hypothetical protein
MNIYGGNTGMTYEDIQRKKKIAAELLQANQNTPRNVGEGLSAIGRALAARGIERRMEKADKANRDAFNTQYGDVFNGGFTGQGYSGGSYSPPPPPNPYDAQYPTGDTGPAPQGEIDAASGLPLSQPVSVIPEDIKAGIFAGESGGDYDALFGFSQRAGGKFAGVKPTDMTVGEVLEFQSPSGQYGQWVKGQVGRVATPIGAYQIVGTTLRGAVEAGVVKPGERFTQDVQDRVGKWILDTQGTGAWEGYKGPQKGGAGRAAGQVAGGGNQMTIQALAEAAGSPYASPGQKAVLNALLQQRMQAMDPSTQLDLQYKQAQIKALDAKANGAEKGTEYGLTPQYGTDAEGNLVLIQLGKDGTAKETPLPEGVALQKGVEKLDLGTSFQWYNTLTGQPIGQPVPKDTRGEARDKKIGEAEGEATGEAVANIGGTVAKAQQALDLIQSIRDDPALASVTGMVQGRLPPMTQGGTDLNVKIQQMQGKVFLEAFDSLKGGGQITEVEGAKAEAAMARLNRAQSTEAYQEALSELSEIIKTGMERAQQKAGQGAPAQVGGSAMDFNAETPPAGLNDNDADLWKYATPDERKAIWGK